MKAKREIAFLLLVWVLFWAVGVKAQQQPPHATPMPHQNAYAQLQEQVNFLRNVAKQFPDPQLLQLLDQIDQHMAAARQAAQAGKSRRASQELKIAQNLTRTAMKLVMTGPVARLREQLDERIRQAEQAIHVHFNPEAQRLLQQAKTTRRKAELAYNRHHVQKAMEFYRMAMYQVNKALQMVTGTGGPGLVSALNEEKATYEDLRRRAQHLISMAHRPGMSQELYQQAIQQQRRAEEALSRGNLQQAVELYRWASRLLIRVIDMSGTSESNWKQRAAEELEKTRELLRSVNQAFSTQMMPQVRQLLQQATRVFLDAQAAFARQEYPQVVKKAELSRRLLNRIGQLQRPAKPGAAGSLSRDRQVLQDLISQLRRNGAEKNQEATQLLNLAELYISQSAQAEKVGRGTLASARLFVAARLTNMARNLLTTPPTPQAQQVPAEQWISRFQDRLRQMQSRREISRDPTVQVWFSLAQELDSKVQSALRKGQKEVAARYSQMGLQLLQRIETRLNKR